MSKPKRGAAASAAPAKPERPQGGGSYLRDPVTKKLTLVEVTAPIPDQPVAPAEDEAGETEADQGAGASNSAEAGNGGGTDQQEG